MTPDAFIKIGIRLHGRKAWKARLARDLGVDVSTIHRMAKRPEIPGPVEIALKAILNNRIAQNKLEKEARKLLPKRPRKRSPKNAAKRKAKLVARRPGARHPQPGLVRPDEKIKQETETDGVLPT